MTTIPEIWFYQLEKKGVLFISKKSANETNAGLLNSFLYDLLVIKTKAGDLIVKKHLL